MKIGYARVSSHGQSLASQIEKLEEFGCEKIFQEKRSGAGQTKRPEVVAALEFCREGDALVITKLDRLARSMTDLQNISATLERKKVNFVVLDQNIDTTTPAGRLTFHLLGAVAEFEREIIEERRNDGIQRAKANGVKFGRSTKLSPNQVCELTSEVKNGVGRKELMLKYDISKSTFYRLLSSSEENPPVAP